MSDNVCPNCGKKHRWYEVKKIDPITKKQICRNCNTPLHSNDGKPEALQEILDSSYSSESHIKKLVIDIIGSFNQMRQNQKVITNPSIPITYFGDYVQYQKSYPKVITVGLNPSHNEFPQNSRFTRFKEAEKLNISSTLNENEIVTYLNLLNNYFKDNPNNWFDSYNPILDGLNTSFYPNTAGNNTIHTNLCSPFATDITWSKLRNSAQYTFSREGRKFWHRLIEILEPDIILFSIAREYLERVMFRKSGWKIFTSITKKKDGSPRSKPYNIEITESMSNSKKMYLVYGQSAYLPFGSLSYNIKLKLGEELMSLFN